MTSKKSFEPTERVTMVSLIDHVQVRHKTHPANVKSHIFVLAMAAAKKWNSAVAALRMLPSKSPVLIVTCGIWM
jgi:hypothetical protein